MTGREAIAAAVLCSIFAPGAPQAAPPVPNYTANPAESRLQFTGTQAGAEFKGVFHKFSAAIQFAPETLEGSHFDVTIEVNSLDSMDNDRDQTMRGSDIFNAAHWPTAHYATHGFTKTATGYRAAGALTLRGVTREVPVDFSFTPGPAGAKLEGSASLKRLDFGVGQGDWKSTEWVGDAVKISFSLALKPTA